MPQKVVIASDSTSDLNAALIAQYDVKLLPLGVTLGAEQYVDGVDIDPEMIYRHYAERGELPKTSAPSIGAFEDFFAQHTADGAGLVFFTISAEMSSTYQHARLAAAEHPGVYVVDTRNLSTGAGLLVVAAGEMAAAGKSAAQIAQACSELIPLVDASFIIDDLEFLHKGGRCSAVAAFGANLLQLKPCIGVKDGKMGVSKKYRGRFASVLGKYIDDRLADPQSIRTEHVFVTHAGCDPAIVEACVERVSGLLPEATVHVTRAGCTISAHCGRNTLGVLFLHK
jgi:DegV family protein with EDD domain